MDFCHIAPTRHLDDFATGRRSHLVLAHLIEQDELYAQWYLNEKLRTPDCTIIMDNSAFEMYKQNRPMYPSEKLIEMGNKVAADYIVMSDYPGERGIKTIQKAEQTAPQLREAGFKTFFVPQSEVGDLGDLLHGFEWASESPHVDYIGVSILAVPNAYGVERGNKLQRFLSRWAFFNIIKHNGVLHQIKDNDKKIHCLGMVDGPNEIFLLKEFFPHIDSWDSSAAVWAGLNDIKFDRSPTGLVNGKFEVEVDFDFYTDDNKLLKKARENVEYIDEQIRKIAMQLEKV